MIQIYSNMPTQDQRYNNRKQSFFAPYYDRNSSYCNLKEPFFVVKSNTQHEYGRMSYE